MCIIVWAKRCVVLLRVYIYLRIRARTHTHMHTHTHTHTHTLRDKSFLTCELPQEWCSFFFLWLFLSFLLSLFPPLLLYSVSVFLSLFSNLSFSLSLSVSLAFSISFSFSSSVSFPHSLFLLLLFPSIWDFLFSCVEFLVLFFYLSLSLSLSLSRSCFLYCALSLSHTAPPCLPFWQCRSKNSATSCNNATCHNTHHKLQYTSLPCSPLC